MTVPARRPKGLDLLLEHCRALGGVERGRSGALDRLEEALGEELARRLVSALASAQPAGRRGGGCCCW